MRVEQSAVAVIIAIPVVKCAALKWSEEEVSSLQLVTSRSMSECGLPSRPIKGGHNWFLLLTIIVFALVAATAVYLFGFTDIKTSRSTKEHRIKYSTLRSLQDFRPKTQKGEDINLAPRLFSTGRGDRLKAPTTPKDGKVHEMAPNTYRETVQRDITMNDGSKSEAAKRSSVSSSIIQLNAEHSSKSISCQLPAGGFKAWKSGLVTVLEPVIPRRDCKKLMAGDKAEARRIQAASKQWTGSITDTLFLKQTRDCNHLQQTFKNNLYNTILERDFPVAFTFVVNGSPQQVFRLLKLLYRPQNVFCIHYDVKTPPSVRQVFDNIAKCFGNVMVATKLEDVIWGYYTIMQAQMNCLHDLHRYRENQSVALKWRYVINVCGKELPMVTNCELVSRLMALHGSSSVMTSEASKEEMKKRIEFQAVLDKKRGKAVTSSSRLGAPPFGIKIYKGSSYNAFSYSFVHFMLTNSTIQTIYKFFMKCKNAEEHFYASVYMMPGVPGGFDPNVRGRYFAVARAIWCFNGRQCKEGFYCHGQVLHTVCITNSGDLPAIVKSSTFNGYLFHNKYFAEMDHTVMDCLEERIIDQNREEYRQECGVPSS